VRIFCIILLMTVNQQIAKLFFQMADYLEMEGVAFKPAAYRIAAQNLENLPENVSKILRQKGKKGLMEIQGIGENLASKIEEYLKTGKIEALEKIKMKIPVDLEELITIEGIGPKRIKILYKKLGVKNKTDLKKALLEHKVAKIFGFGEKIEKNLMEAMSLVKKGKRRFLLEEIKPGIEKIVSNLKKLKEVEKISVAGSVRRQKKDIGDLDILVVSNQPKKVMDFFVKMPEVIKVWGVGPTKASVATLFGFDADLRIVQKKSYGAALMYFTGSREYNIVMRRLAQKKGWKLNEYGLFDGTKMIAGETEEEIYQTLGIKWLPPEKREI